MYIQFNQIKLEVIDQFALVVRLHIFLSVLNNALLCNDFSYIDSNLLYAVTKS